jgi:hypothetical protein
MIDWALGYRIDNQITRTGIESIGVITWWRSCTQIILMGATRASYGLGHVPGRGRTPTSFVDSLDIYINNALNRIHAGDENQFYINIGYEFSRLHILPDDNIDVTVLVWRKCCLEAYDKWICILERVKAPYKTKYYLYIQLGKTGIMIIEYFSHFKFYRAGCFYSQFYLLSKNFFSVSNIYVYEYPD